MTAALQTTIRHAAPPAGPTVSVTTIDAALHEHLTPAYWEWRRLYDADPAATPLAHPDLVLSDVAHLSTMRLWPVLIAAEQGTAWSGVAALLPKRVSLTRLGGIGIPATIEGLRIAGNGCLTRSETAHLPLLEAALQHVRTTNADFLLIEDVDVESPVGRALSELVPESWLTFRHTGVQAHRQIHLPTTRDEYWNTFSKKTLSTLRRKQKKFGATRLERITQIGDVPRFLEVAHEISRQTWQTRQLGLRIRNDARELAQLTSLAQHGLLRSYLWFSNDVPVAFLQGQQDKGRYFYDEVGYATAFARYSPGQVMLVQVLDDLFAHERPEWFDFGEGDAEYKQFFSNTCSHSGTVWLFPPSIRNHGIVAWLCASQAVRRCSRRIVAAGGWTSRARQWVRYGGQTLFKRDRTETAHPE